jgi:hypothetical protein
MSVVPPPGTVAAAVVLRQCPPSRAGTEAEHETPAVCRGRYGRHGRCERASADLSVAAHHRKAIVARLNAAAVEALSEPAVRQRLTDLGKENPPPEQQKQAALAAFHKAEIDKWWPIIRQAGIKGE